MATINTDIAQKIDIVVRENNTATINLDIASESGIPYNLTGYTCSFEVHDADGVIVYKIVNAVTSDFGSIVDGNGSSALSSDGKLVISLTTTATNRNPGSYKYKLKLLSDGGTDNRTWMYGKFKINND